MEKKSNFCLFMPLFDLLGGTLDDKSWELQKEISSGKNEQVPDFVFLAHVVDVMSSMHVSFVFRSFSALPFCTKPQMLLMWPVRVVHGNTLTAAVILSEIPENVTEVFLTGATSKLGRAIALYLSRKRVRVC
ncbi:hypothetical protein B296_00003670 [Ensete ventricosum]|uniref:Very-long-chain aldehyde decarbonylase CER1-like C-terminal domain-containing protein n=1 Tax=Ensete ventricosum TaxID=4639 RepID=A0A427B9X3_ENSVE|nr:hypothetical protein B296_00003670 [Ensete ventricosum]